MPRRKFENPDYETMQFTGANGAAVMQWLRDVVNPMEIDPDPVDIYFRSRDGQRLEVNFSAGSGWVPVASGNWLVFPTVTHRGLPFPPSGFGMDGTIPDRIFQQAFGGGGNVGGNPRK